MTQEELAHMLNGKLVDLYYHMKMRDISMPIYMSMLAVHVAALSAFQDDPETAAEEFIADLRRGVATGMAEVGRVRGVRPI